MEFLVKQMLKIMVKIDSRSQSYGRVLHKLNKNLNHKNAYLPTYICSVCNFGTLHTILWATTQAL
jgi:hypothetical protein